MIAGQSGLPPRLLSALNTNTDAFFIESIEKYSVWIRVRQRALRHNIYDVLSFSVIPNTCLSLTCPPGVSGVHDLSCEGIISGKGAKRGAICSCCHVNNMCLHLYTTATM